MPHLSLRTILARLRRLYEPPKTFLKWRTPLDLVVVTILSAQCTDKRVNEVSERLFRKYRRPEDYLGVSRRKLECDIHSCGTYRNKARYIQGLCRILIGRHKGKVPRTMEELVALPGVGRKTASIILYAAFGKNKGIAVDTHVMRLARRLGLSGSKNQDRIEKDLMKQVPRREWGEVTTLLISHGRAVCTARNRKCEECVFRKQCPSSKVMGRRDLAEERHV